MQKRCILTQASREAPAVRSEVQRCVFAVITHVKIGSFRDLILDHIDIPCLQRKTTAERLAECNSTASSLSEAFGFQRASRKDLGSAKKVIAFLRLLPSLHRCAIRQFLSLRFFIFKSFRMGTTGTPRSYLIATVSHSYLIATQYSRPSQRSGFRSRHGARCAPCTAVA